MSIRLIVNADDYGRTPGVSSGIREAHLGGIVTSTSAMMNLPGVEEDLRAAMQRTPRLGLGVHLVLTLGHPVLPPEGLASVVDADGRFPDPDLLARRLLLVDPGEVRAEWRTQIEKFKQSTGREPDHLDSHHHCSYFSEELFRTMLELADDCGCPIRYPLAAAGAVDFPDELCPEVDEFVPRLLEEYQPLRPQAFLSRFYDSGVTKENLLALIEDLSPGTTELMCHPGFSSDELVRESDYAHQREHELAILTDREVKSALLRRGVQLISYAGL
ncbi:MAG: ChbG/HpnK family deacetylase [Anaerolineales bacterium]|nr:ChbG/HpnK family deacetylase [Anaerolineales bacterium]